MDILCNRRLSALSLNVKHKERKNSRRNSNKPEYKSTFGICFDIDGVLVRGSEPISASKRAFQRLRDIKVPYVFLTNSCGSDIEKAKKISKIIDIEVNPEEVIQAQSPLKLFTELHDKFCLIVGQGDIEVIANDIGFKDICTLEDITKAYPLLDMVDHNNRQQIANNGYTEKGMRTIESVVLMGEPTRWEAALQLIVDVLRTDGRPSCEDYYTSDDSCYTTSSCSSEEYGGLVMRNHNHIPVFACNADLQFQDRAKIPRYGHGAFLCCLEALYKKISGRQLHYTQLMGKPSELSFRYAEHILSEKTRKMMGSYAKLKTMYMIGDTPQADIVGANLYRRHIERERIINKEGRRGSLPRCRIIPKYSNLSKQTVSKVESILVCTGVYKPDEEEIIGAEHHHRDFTYTRQRSRELETPTIVLEHVDHAVKYILEKEGKL